MAKRDKPRFIRRHGKIIPIGVKKKDKLSKKAPVIASVLAAGTSGFAARKAFQKSSQAFKLSSISAGLRSFIPKGTKESKHLAKGISLGHRRGKKFALLAGAAMVAGGFAAQTLAEIGLGRNLPKGTSDYKGEALENIAGSAGFVAPFLIGRGGAKITGLRQLLKKGKLRQAFRAATGVSKGFGQATMVKRKAAAQAFKNLRK